MLSSVLARRRLRPVSVFGGQRPNMVRFHAILVRLGPEQSGCGLVASRPSLSGNTQPSLDQCFDITAPCCALFRQMAGAYPHDAWDLTGWAHKRRHSPGRRGRTRTVSCGGHRRLPAGCGVVSPSRGPGQDSIGCGVICVRLTKTDSDGLPLVRPHQIASVTPWMSESW
jgi:hypothetical protein